MREAPKEVININIAMICNQDALSAWQVALHRRLAELAGVRVRPFFCSAGQPAALAFHYRLDSKIYRSAADSVARRPASELAGAEEIAELTPALLQENDLVLDFVGLRLAGSPPPFGVWCFLVGEADARLPGGYREFLKKESAVVSRICAHVPGGDVRLLYESYSCTDTTSYFRNLSFPNWKFVEASATLVARICGSPEQFLAFAHACPAFQPQPQPVPGWLRTGRTLAVQAARTVRSRLYARRRFKQWYLAYSVRAQYRDSPASFRRLMPPKSAFWADPFVWPHPDGGHVVFFEEYLYEKNRAHLSCLRLDEAGNQLEPPRPILIEDFHLSYPFVFSFQNQLYMIPEASESGQIRLYRCAEFPHRWEYLYPLMESVRAYDITLHQQGDIWWLFATMTPVEGMSPDDNLYCFYSDSPLSKNWTPHPCNPVVSDVRSARPAGRLFLQDGMLIRPAQDCSVYYGRSLKFQHVTRLSREEYQEENLFTRDPDWTREVERCHTWNQMQDGFVIIDALENMPF